MTSVDFHASDGDEEAERDLDVDVLQVVLARALDDDRSPGRRAPLLRRLDRQLPLQVGARQRSVAVRQQVRGRALEDELSAVLARAGPEIDDVVRGADGLFVVLDDHDGVAEIAQPRERRQQRTVVALVQTDRRFVEDVKDAGQVRSDLRREADALPFSAGQRRGAAAEGQVTHADVVQEPQPVADLAQDPVRDQTLAIRQLEAFEGVQRLRDRQVHVLGDGPTFDAYGAALRLQTLTLAGRARPQRAIRLQPFLLDPAALFVAAAQVGHETLEAGAEGVRVLLLLPGFGCRLTSGLGAPSGIRALFLRAVEQHVADLLRQAAERDAEIDPEEAGERGQRFFHELLVAARPRRDRAVLQRQVLVGHEPRRIEVVHRPQSLAFLAGAVRRVERERPRRHLRHADAAVGARQPPREQPIAAVQRVDDDDVVGQV